VRKHPKVYHMESLVSGGGGLVDIDTLIVASGSDARGFDVLSKYAGSSAAVNRVLVLEFEERNQARAAQELKEERRKAKSVGIPLIPIKSKLEEPSTCIPGLSKVGIKGGYVGKIGIDMTLFTRPFLFWLLKYLERTRVTNDAIVYYTEPESYRYTKGTYDYYQDTEGPLEVLEVPGFPGTPRYSGTSNLTVLLGFDGQLASAINEDIAPMGTIVVNGFPGYFQKYKDISLVNNERLVSGAQQVICCPADNPFETYNTLDRVRHGLGNTFMTVAPLGPKPMALGACLFAIDNEDVRIVYPRPQQYTSQTTRASWKSWRYDVHFGRTGKKAAK